MSRIARLAVLVTALTSLFAVASSTAGAVTWTNTGSTTFHATGVGIEIHTGGNVLKCTGSTATGTAPSHSALAVYSVPGTVTYSPCSLFGQSTYVHCGFTLTGAVFGAGVTSGPIDLTCTARLTSTNTALCHIEGSAGAHYINPTAATNTPGKFTLTTSSTITTTNSSGTSCLLGTGEAHLTEHTWTVTSVIGSPIINRHL